MEQIINLFTCGDPRPLIYVWSGIFVIYFGVMFFYLTRYAKKHPEVKEVHQKNDAQTQEILRRYKNITLLGFCMVFVWAAGVMLLVVGFKPSPFEWLAIGIIILAMLWPISGIKRKKN